MIGHLLNRSCDIIRGTTWQQVGVEWVEVPAVVATLPCRIAPASGRELEVAGRMQAEVTHSVYLQAGADIRVGDKLEADGITYEVTVPNISPSVPTHHHKALVKQMQVGS